MENVGGVIFFAIVVIMFGVTAYLYFYGDDLNLKFWEDDSDSEIAAGVVEVNETGEVNAVVNDSESAEILDLDDEINSSHPHWDHQEIKYKIIDRNVCLTKPLEDFEEAVNLIELGSENAVDFVEVYNEEYDIEVQCVDRTGFFEYLENTTNVTCKNYTIDTRREYFDPIVEGYIEEGDYYVSHKTLKQNDTYSNFEYCYYDSSATDAGNYSWDWFFESEPEIESGIIKSHKISLFDEESHSRCLNIPTREIHELLHGLGFAHVETPEYYPDYGWSPADFNLLEDVMFEYRYCSFQKKIQEKYFDCLKNIYLGEDVECEGVNFLG
ncbi:MAG: hypothetical protein KC506_00730 [Nanoarchaeota archaeon]|nr:hypothetical protein [Nanoarchaeota archaeon]